MNAKLWWNSSDGQASLEGGVYASKEEAEAAIPVVEAEFRDQCNSDCPYDEDSYWTIETIEDDDETKKARQASATAEMAVALSAVNHFWETPEDLRFWRDEDGRLFATEWTAVIPGARRVEIEFEPGAGYRALD